MFWIYFWIESFLGPIQWKNEFSKKIAHPCVGEELKKCYTVMCLNIVLSIFCVHCIVHICILVSACCPGEKVKAAVFTFPPTLSPLTKPLGTFSWQIFVTGSGGYVKVTYWTLSFLLHCTMCTLFSIFPAQANKLRPILKFVLRYPIQHIFVPACSIAQNNYLLYFLLFSNSESVISP